MITEDKITEIFCMMDEFCKNLDETLNKQLRLCVGNDGKLFNALDTNVLQLI